MRLAPSPYVSSLPVVPLFARIYRISATQQLVRMTAVSYFYGPIVAILLCILYTLTPPGQHSLFVGTATPRLVSRAGLRHGGQSMQRYLHALLIVVMALCGVLLVAAPRFFLLPP